MAKSSEEILAGLAATREEASAPEETQTEAEEPGTVQEDEPASDGEPEDEEDEESEDLEDSEDEDEPEEESEDEESEEEEESTADRDIARIQQAEKEAKQRIQEQVVALEAKQNDAAEKLAKAEEIEAKRDSSLKRAKSHPIAAAKALGFKTHEEFVEFGTKCFRYGKGLAPDAAPEHKQWTQSIEKDGETASSMEALKAEVAKFKAERDTEKQTAKQTAEQAELDAVLNDYTDSIVSAATSDAPLASSIIKNGGEEARESIKQLALQISNEIGRPPTPEEVLMRIEDYEREQLRLRGIDPEKYSPKKITKSKAKSSKAAKKKKATPKKSQESDDQQRKPKKSRAEVLKGLERLKSAQG